MSGQSCATMQVGRIPFTPRRYYPSNDSVFHNMTTNTPPLLFRVIEGFLQNCKKRPSAAGKPSIVARKPFLFEKNLDYSEVNTRKDFTSYAVPGRRCEKEVTDFNEFLSLWDKDTTKNAEQSRSLAILRCYKDWFTPNTTVQKETGLATVSSAHRIWVKNVGKEIKSGRNRLAVPEDIYKSNGGPIVTDNRDENFVTRFIFTTAFFFSNPAMVRVLAACTENALRCSAHWWPENERDIKDFIYVSMLGEYAYWSRKELKYLYDILNSDTNKRVLYVYDYRTALNFLCLLCSVLDVYKAQPMPAVKTDVYKQRQALLALEPDVNNLRKAFVRKVKDHEARNEKDFAALVGVAKHVRLLPLQTLREQLRDGSLQPSSFQSNFVAFRLGFYDADMQVYIRHWLVKLKPHNDLAVLLSGVPSVPAQSLTEFIDAIGHVAPSLAMCILKSPTGLDYFAAAFVSSDVVLDKLYAVWKFKDMGVFKLSEVRTYLSDVAKLGQSLDTIELMALNLALPPNTYTDRRSQTTRQLTENAYEGILDFNFIKV